jgi:hypothetical protein
LYSSLQDLNRGLVVSVVEVLLALDEEWVVAGAAPSKQKE